MEDIFFNLLAGFAYFFTAWFFYYPFFMFQPVFSGTKNGASDILNYLGGDIINLPSFFPSFLTNPENIHIPNFIWISILIIIIILFYSNKIKLDCILEKKTMLQRSFAIILFFVSVFLLSYYPHIHLQKQNLFIIDKIPIYKTAKLFHYLEDVGTKNKGKLFRLKEGYSYDLYVNLNSWKNRKKTLSLNFKNNIETDIIIYSKTKLLSELKDKKELNFQIKLSTLKTLKFKNKKYGHISIQTKNKINNSHIYLTINSQI